MTGFTGPAAAPGWFQSSIPGRAQMAAAAASGNIGVGGVDVNTAVGNMGTPRLLGGAGASNPASLRADAKRRARALYLNEAIIRAAEANDEDAMRRLWWERDRLNSGGA
jgi:hypothetical protein